MYICIIFVALNDEAKLNVWIKTYAEDNGHFYVDLLTSMVDHRNGMKSDFIYDEVLPTEDDYIVMEQFLEKSN